MSETASRELRSRSRSLIRQSRKGGKILKEETITHTTTLKENSLTTENTLSHDCSFADNGFLENGQAEIHDNFHNEIEDLNRHLDHDSPWQNGRYKSAQEILNYYKGLGDCWWNYLPKTDNTYNPMSKWYRKEIAPGIPVIPNMARPPLHSTPPNSSLFSRFSTESKYAESLHNHRSDEVSSSVATTAQSSWFRRVVTTITTVVVTAWSVVTMSHHRSELQLNGKQPMTGRRLHQESVASAWWSALFRWLYRTMMLPFIFDVGALVFIRWAASRVATRTGAKLLMLFLLLLPLILFFWLYRDRLLDGDSTLLEDTARISKASIAGLGGSIAGLGGSIAGLGGGIANVSSGFFSWLSNLYGALASYSSESTRSGIGVFYTALDLVSGTLTSASQFFVNTAIYLYGLLSLLPTLRPQFSQSDSAPISIAAQSMSKEQLLIIVQEAVRETLKRDSAVFLGDTMNHPRFKVLLEKALAEKVDGWDPAVLLTSNQWRSAIKDAVSVYNSEHPDKEGDLMRERLAEIEKRTDWNSGEITKLHERISVLEKEIDSVLHTFMTRKNLEESIKNLTVHFNYKLKISEEHTMERVLAEVTEKVREDVSTLYYSLKDNHHQVEMTGESINLTQVKDYVSLLIERALTLYDADKIGMVDYALESSGGNVLSTRCTESYESGQQTFVLFGFALWHRSNSPRTLIQPGVHPGECWAFSGQQGYVVLQLSSTIVVTAFTVEHIPRSLAPHGRIDSAPKDFSVWGLKFEDDKDAIFLGRFHFQENGTSLQKFQAVPVEEPFRLVELKIESNHGNLAFTCLYRFRVHGVPVS